MKSTLSRIAACVLALTVAATSATAGAQECASDAGQGGIVSVAAAVDGAAAHSRWRTALHVADDVAGAAGLAVGVAVVAGASAPVLTVVGVSVGGYFAVRAVGDLIARRIHHESIDPLHSAAARGDWLGLAAGGFGVGELATGARLIGGLQAARVLGVSGMVAGLATMPDAVVGLGRNWSRLGKGERGMALAQVGLVAVTLGRDATSAIALEEFRAPAGTVEVRGATPARYVLDENLGHGAFGNAWRGHDDAGRPVVVKLARTDQDPGPNRDMLMKEAGVLASVDGAPELPRFLGVGRDADGNPALVMSYSPGSRLASTEATRTNPGATVRIVRKMLRAVISLNGVGRRHGDLHYGNVLVDGGNPDSVVVIDLGMSDPLAEPHPWGKSAWGSRDYEQTTGDVYSVGSMLLDLLTGVPLKSGQALIRTPEPELAQNLARIPDPGLRSVVARAIDPNPAKRYRTAQELFDALAPFESRP